MANTLSNGSRIINLNKLQQHLLNTITQHAVTCQLCTKEALSGHEAVVLIGKQNRQGFCSILTSCCAGCKEEFSFPTSAEVKPMSGGKYWECNLAAVWGQMATGGRHTLLTESMAVMGIPAMTKKSFIAIEKELVIGGGIFFKILRNKLVLKRKLWQYQIIIATRECQQ